VTLFEAGAQLGGQALLAQLLPGRAEFGGIVTNLAREMAAAGVKVRLNTRVDAAFLADMAPEVIILATGATTRNRDEFEIAEDAHVVDAVQVLQSAANVGGRVVIHDWRGDWTGLGLAEQLAASGRHVRLAVNGIAAGIGLQYYVRDAMVARAARLGVEIVPYMRLFGADGTTAYFQHVASGEVVVMEDVDTLVLAQGPVSDNTLMEALEGRTVARIMAVGDCMAPRTAEEAVLEGLRAGWAC
jgi:hypothetical protein